MIFTNRKKQEVDDTKLLVSNTHSMHGTVIYVICSYKLTIKSIINVGQYVIGQYTCPMNGIGYVLYTPETKSWK